MSEVNHDPIAKLAKFTPAGGPDAAELLFAAGRASARVPWQWKASVVVLVALNVALSTLLVLRSITPPEAPVITAPQPEAPPAPVAVPRAEPPPTDDPSSYRVLLNSNLDGPPRLEPVPNLAPGREPLTVRAGRRGEID